MLPMYRQVLAACTMGALLTLGGCTQHASEQDKADAAERAAVRQQQADDAIAARKGISAAEGQLAQLPPPSKGRYLQVHTSENWGNPFVIVGRKTLTLRVLLSDADAESVSKQPKSVFTGKLRVVNGSRRELTLRLIDLPEALAALPESSWQYGRVVAVDEDPATGKRERPQVRRNVEAVMAMLNDLDVVVNEWPYGLR
ncbi:hypothetical protein D1Y84_10790 [Acidipila sp. EB88]|nr:hypothetical protein D1Y84_10790 [Acidipila sp. EB88]